MSPEELKEGWTPARRNSRWQRAREARRLPNDKDKNEVTAFSEAGLLIGVPRTQGVQVLSERLRVRRSSLLTLFQVPSSGRRTGGVGLNSRQQGSLHRTHWHFSDFRCSGIHSHQIMK